MKTFLLSLSASVLVALVYGILFSQREDRVRQYLRQKRQGWLRRHYVLVFVGAIRGRAASTDTAVIAFLGIFVLIVIASSMWFSVEYLDQKLSSVETLITFSESRVASMSRALSGETDRPSEEDLRLELEDLRLGWAELRDELVGLKGRADPVFLAGRVFAGLQLLVAMLALFFWHPFVVMRRRFAHELDRFALRIQGLASKAELAELAVTESEVTDERSLRRFVDKARQIAERHKVATLVETFDLWEGSVDTG